MGEGPYSTLTDLQAAMRACRRCLEAGHAIAPGAVFSGNREAQVMIIGQAPGVTEAQVKRPFNAGSGTRLFRWLADAGWNEDDFRASHYMTAVTKCYPGKGSSKGDRVPTRSEQVLCRPFLEQELALVAPRLIIPVGGLAIKLFFPAKLRLDQVVGTAVYFAPEMLARGAVVSARKGRRISGEADLMACVQEVGWDGRFVVPLPHPSGASLWPNKPANQALIARAARMLGTLRKAWNL